MKPTPNPRKSRALVAAPIAQGAQPAAFTTSDVTSMQALAGGVANEGQQRRALDWILKDACGLPLWPYRESQRETDIALGRQFVGQQIMGLLKINATQLKQREQQKETEYGS